MNPRVALGIAFLWILPAVVVSRSSHKTKVFNVKKFGAIGNNKTENSKAFTKAWNESCKWRGKSSVLIPKGTYHLGSIVLKGPCNGRKEFVIKGMLRSPNQPATSFFIDHWITFQNINNLRIHGGGTLDGQGASAWSYNKCNTGSCKRLPVSLRLDFVNDSEISHIKSLNSKNFHFNLFACNRVNIRHVVLSAPADSPNTDGIHVSSSGNINIDKTVISTGDDCVSIGPGNRDIHITNTFCGPGHGISVGSMGKSGTKEDVTGISVVNCTFRGTLNGVQIKTWPDPEAAGGFASNFTYDNILMEKVDNPIFINQQYCPFNLCNPQGSSKIQISNIIFRNIRGTSTTKDAVKLKCSKSNPCHNIALENINLIGPGGLASASCSNVHGRSSGRQKPPSCFS